MGSTPGATTAYVMRPADVTDIDATSSVGSGIPVDPQVECDGTAGGGSGCNNIKTTTVTIVSLTTTGIATGLCSSSSPQTTGLVYSASTYSPTSYSIDWNAAANTAGLADQGMTTHTTYTFLAGGGTMTGIVIPANVPGGSYSGILTIYNAAGCTNSYPISITLGTLITAQPVSITSCPSGIITLSVTATNATGYQWYKGNVGSGVAVSNGTSTGATIAGATTSTLTITNPVYGTSNGNYYVTVSGSCGTINSTAATVTLNPAPIISTAATPAVVAALCGGNFASQTTTMAYSATTNSPTSIHY